MPEPLPDHGWSREVVVLKNAVVVPPKAPGFQVSSGVWSEDGDCLHAANWRGKVRMTLPIQERPKDPEPYSGRHLWGGLYYGHFGHFMTETISRLWALPLHDVDSVIFCPKHETLRGQFSNYQAEFWSLLDTKAEVMVARRPMLVEELVVPGQGFGLGPISAATPEFQSLLRKITAKIPDSKPERIYISRTRFGGQGGVLAETVIEENLKKLGYTAIYPEKMKLLDQLRVYKSATHILGVDSSAFHIASMVANPDQKIGFILRRSNNGHKDIETQVSSWTGRPPTVINVLVANWAHNIALGSNHLSWGEIDHGALRDELAAAGFIPADAEWKIPTSDELTESINRAMTISKLNLHRIELVRSPNS